MKTLKDQLNEGIRVGLVEYKPIFNIQSDIYNVLEALAYQYELKSKKFDQKEVDEALEWFSLHFFED